MKTFFEPQLHRTWIAAGTAVVGIGTSIYSGIKQKNEAKKLASQNPYPIQTTPQAEIDNQQIARQMANEGLPSQQYANAMKNIERQRNAAIRAATDRRAGVGLIGQIQDNTDRSISGLDAADANARLQNQRQLIGVNNRIAGYQQDAFNWNSKNKYNQNYNYGMQLEGAGNANILHGIDQAGGFALYANNMGLFGGKPRKNNSGSGGYGSDPNIGGSY